MTFQDFGMHVELSQEPRALHFRQKKDASLGRTEWDVVGMARGDGPRSFNPNGVIARLKRSLFGIRVAQPLANERLETLRRFAVRAWFWDVVRLKDMRVLFAAGFSSNDGWRILAHVASYRGFMPSVEAWP